MGQVDLHEKMRIVADFPKKGISYKDITPILEDPDALQAMVDQLAASLKSMDFDYILGAESRGFVCGMPVAYKLHKGFIMVRKPGKLPGRVISESYELEYGTATVELDKDYLPEGSKVVVMDDLLATGGTALASCHLAERAGAKVVDCIFMTELTDLGGRKKLEDEGYKVKSLMTWPV